LVCYNNLSYNNLSYKKLDLEKIMDIINTILKVVNLYGLIFTIVLVFPYAVYLRSGKVNENSLSNRGMLYFERIGKYCSAFLMSINIGILEAGFTAPIMKKFWLISTSIMLVFYIVSWIGFSKTNKKGFAYAAAIIAGLVVMYSGLLQVRPLLLFAGIVFFIGEIYTVRKIIK
jgi:hypothetical protein